MKSTLTSSVAGLALILAGALSASAQVSNFDALNGYATGMETRMARLRDATLRSTAAESESAMTVSVGYLNRKLSAAKDSLERNAKGENGQFGVSWNKSDWELGLTIGTESITNDYNEVHSPSPTPLHGKVKATTTNVAVEGGFKAGSLRIIVSGSLAASTYSGTRISDAGSSHVDYKGDDHSLGLRIPYEIKVSEAYVFEPYAAVSLLKGSVDGFTEQGTAPDRRIVKSFTQDLTYGAIGLRFAGKQSEWTPSATVALFDRLSGGDTSINNSAINGANLGVGKVPQISSSQLYVGAGLEGKIADHWRLGFEAAYVSGGSEKEFTARLNLRRSF